MAVEKLASLDKFVIHSRVLFLFSSHSVVSQNQQEVPAAIAAYVEELDTTQEEMLEELMRIREMLFPMLHRINELVVSARGNQILVEEVEYSGGAGGYIASDNVPCIERTIQILTPDHPGMRFTLIQANRISDDSVEYTEIFIFIQDVALYVWYLLREDELVLKSIQSISQRDAHVKYDEKSPLKNGDEIEFLQKVLDDSPGPDDPK